MKTSLSTLHACAIFSITLLYKTHVLCTSNYENHVAVSELLLIDIVQVISISLIYVFLINIMVTFNSHLLVCVN